jgi:hypothetical protein
MCVKIVRNKETVEFDPSQPLEEQVRGCKQVVINYKPEDSQLQSFMEQFDRIIKTGVGCQMNIKFSANNTLDGIRTERKIDHLSKALEFNEVIRAVATIHHETDKQLTELSQLCIREVV